MVVRREGHGGLGEAPRCRRVGHGSSHLLLEKATLVERTAVFKAGIKVVCGLAHRRSHARILSEASGWVITDELWLGHVRFRVKLAVHLVKALMCMLSRQIIIIVDLLNGSLQSLFFWHKSGLNHLDWRSLVRLGWS